MINLSNDFHNIGIRRKKFIYYQYGKHYNVSKYYFTMTYYSVILKLYQLRINFLKLL